MRRRRRARRTAASEGAARRESAGSAFRSAGAALLRAVCTASRLCSCFPCQLFSRPRGGLDGESLFAHLDRVLGRCGVGPKSTLAFMLCFPQILQNFLLRRLHVWLVRMRQSSCPDPAAFESAEHNALLPMHLPVFEGQGRRGRSGRALRSHKSRASTWWQPSGQLPLTRSSSSCSRKPKKISK